MDLVNDIKKNSKEFLVLGMPDEVIDSLVTDETISSVLEAPDVASDLQKFIDSDLIEEKAKDFLLALKIGINIGVHFGMLSFAQVVANSANAIIQQSEDAEE